MWNKCQERICDIKIKRGDIQNKNQGRGHMELTTSKGIWNKHKERGFMDYNYVKRGDIESKFQQKGYVA